MGRALRETHQSRLVAGDGFREELNPSYILRVRCLALSHCERAPDYALTLSPSHSIAASVPPLPWGMLRALRATSMTPSVPKIIGALTWPIWAIRNAWPERSPMPVPSTTPHFSLQ